MIPSNFFLGQGTHHCSLFEPNYLRLVSTMIEYTIVRERRVLGVSHAIAYCTNVSRGLSAIAEFLVTIPPSTVFGFENLVYWHMYTAQASTVDNALESAIRQRARVCYITPSRVKAQ